MTGRARASYALAPDITLDQNERLLVAEDDVLRSEVGCGVVTDVAGDGSGAGELRGYFAGTGASNPAQRLSISAGSIGRDGTKAPPDERGPT